MKMNRRHMLSVSIGAIAGATGLCPVVAYATPEDTMKAIMDFTGGKEAAEGKLTLTAPEIAENGNTVPISVSVESPMSAEDHVQSVMVLAEGNPNPAVITFNFTPMSGEASATTRMRLAKTQNVVAVAKTSTGEIYMAKREVKVTIGGCGG